MDNYRQRTVQALGWVFGSQLSSQAISFCFGIILARLLAPDDFGLIAMVMVFSGFASLLSDVGFGSALIHKQDANQLHYSSVFWLNLALGCLMAFAFYFSSTWISEFYSRPEIKEIVQLLGLSFIVGSLALVPRIKLRKNLNFKTLTLVDFTGMIISGITGITLAIKGYGYWSLVFQILVKDLVTASLVWAFGKWAPRFSFDMGSIRELFGFSFNVFLSKAVQYLAGKLDVIIIGRVLGGNALGIYDKALSLMLFPLQNVSHVIANVMFPSLSMIQSDKERVKDVYLRCTRAISLLTFPMMVGMFVISESFVMGVLGEQWAELIPVMQIFCISGIIRSIVTVTGAIYLSQGETGLQLKVTILTKPITIAGVIAGVPWGVIGIAIGSSVANLINSIITLSAAGSTINLKLSTLLKTLSPTLFAALSMGLFVTLISPLTSLEKGVLLMLVQMISGALFYWAIIAIMKVRAYQDVMNVLKKQLSTR